MAMQPKVIFCIHQFKKYTCEDKIAQLSAADIVFSGIEVMEYQKVDVKLVSHYDQSAVLKIQTCESDSEQVIKANDNFTNIMSGGNKEYMLVPGHYRFEVITNKNKFTSYYTVRANNFSDDALLNLRQYVETLLKGLSQDLISQRSGMTKPIMDFNPTLIQFFEFINNNRDIIFKNLDLIIKDPITNLLGEYRISKIPSRLDSKSFRWQAQKGERNNSNPCMPSLYYSKHANLTLNTIENAWINYILNSFIQSLRKLEMNFQMEIINLTKKSESQKKLLLENEELISKWSNKYGYVDTVRRLKYKEKRYLQILETLDIDKSKYFDYKIEINQLVRKLKKFSEAECFGTKPYLKPKKVTQRLLKDYRYRKVYTLYKELMRLSSKQSDTANVGIQFKRTWQLFEYYNLGLIIEIFIENDYIWTSGWLADKENPHHHIGILSSNTILRFEKEDSDHYIELAYDAEIATTIDDQNVSRYFSSTGRRPDIRMTIYHRDGSLYSNKCGLIIESKCRRSSYLINQNIDPDVKLQLTDFKKLEYFESKSSNNRKDPVRSPIDKVIVLYPKQSDKKPVELDHIYGESMVYIQVEPTNTDNGEKSFGYYNLKEKIDDFLMQVEGEQYVR